MGTREAAGRGRHFLRGTATLNWRLVCLAVPREEGWERPGWDAPNPRFCPRVTSTPEEAPGITPANNRGPEIITVQRDKASKCSTIHAQLLEHNS